MQILPRLNKIIDCQDSAATAKNIKALAEDQLSMIIQPDISKLLSQSVTADDNWLG